MNYTKGEWEVTHNPSHKEYPYVVNDESPSKVIAQVIGDGISAQGNNANANLIASAPELYETLKDLAACFRNIEILSSVQDDEERHLLGIAIDTMKQALAKADGGK